MRRDPSPAGSTAGAPRARRSRKDPWAYAAAGAATVAVIYAIGYGASQPARIPAKATSAVHGNAPHVQAGRGPTAPGYRDGTFTGTGASQYGDISVGVTVTGGRVASVEVTGVTTFFPANAVSPLIPEVIARQSAQLDAVSGSTGSSQAFQGAVQQALGKARA